MRNGFLKLPWETVANLGYKGTGSLVAWVYANENPDVKVRELAHLFDITHYSATAILRDINGSYKIIQDHTESNKKSSNNAALRGGFIQDHTDSYKIIQDTPVSICSKDKEEDKNNNTPFLRFWKAYPKTNGSRVGALKKWRAMKLPHDENHVDKMVQALEAQVAFKAHCDSTGVFCPDFPFAEKWLGQEKWENVPVIEKGPMTELERLDAKRAEIENNAEKPDIRY